MNQAAHAIPSLETSPAETAVRKEKPLRTAAERDTGRSIERIFLRCSDPIEVKLENFPKYVRRQHLKRFLALYEIFKLAMPVKGSIIECGVFRGFGLMSWAKLSTMLEPENLTRRIYGFDTFDGFPSVGARRTAAWAVPRTSSAAGQGVAEICDRAWLFHTHAPVRRAPPSAFPEHTVRRKRRNARQGRRLTELCRISLYRSSCLRSPSFNSSLPWPAPPQQRRGLFAHLSCQARVQRRTKRPRPRDGEGGSPPAHCRDASRRPRSAC